MNKEAILARVDRFEERKAKYAPVAAILSELYGTPNWQRGLSPMDELISCILSQSTTDLNRDRGFEALKKRYPTWEAVHYAPLEELVETIRPAGLANQKAGRIQAVLERIYQERGEYNIDFLAEMPLDEAKAWLTRLPGVGPKTAAIVLCFAFGLPAFPVDTHVHRVSKRIGFIPATMNAEKAHVVMEAIVPPQDYYRFHIQLIQHGRKLCKARAPLCPQCPLSALCDDYQASNHSEQATE